MLVVFENDGEIDPRAIITFGVNAKEGDQPIGFFGTGLKYALSMLLRNGCEVTIWSGATPYIFAVKPGVIRGKEFNFVTMNDAPLGFTTEVGKNWKMWMAYRELFCNAKDEGGFAYTSSEWPDGEPGRTRVAVKGDRFLDAYHNRAKYILETEPVYTSQWCDIHEGKSSGIYYRGILVKELKEPALYTYNIKTPITLTEDRTAQWDWELKSAVTNAIKAIDLDEEPALEELVDDVLTAPEQSYEHGLDYGWSVSVSPSTSFLSSVDRVAGHRYSAVNRSAIGLYKTHATSPALFRSPMAGEHKATLEAAKALCLVLGFDVSRHFVNMSDRLGENILSEARNGEIFISDTAFAAGANKLAAVLLLEHIKDEYEFESPSEDLQNFLLDKLIELAAARPLVPADVVEEGEL